MMMTSASFTTPYEDAARVWARVGPLLAGADPAGPPAAAVQAWVQFLHTMEDHYAQQARAQGAPVPPLTDPERLTAARLAASFGLWPQDAPRPPADTRQVALTGHER